MGDDAAVEDNVGDGTRPGRRVARRSALGIVSRLCVATLAAVLAGGIVTLSLAEVSSSPVILLVCGGLASAAVWTVVVWRFGGSPRLPGRRVLAGIGALIAVLVLMSLLVPVRDPRIPPTTPPGAGRWIMPDGTELAFGSLHAAAPSRTPVVVLHGGPGVPDLAGDLESLRGLAAQGHDVYAYAQLGAGSSSRLADPTGYTVTRGVADLEQVRRRIGAPRVILIGHSYGAFLAAAYMAAHPDRVEKVVFTSPGSLVDGLSGGALQSRLTWPQRLHTYALLVRPRLLLAYALLQVNPVAAHSFAGDPELDARQDLVYAATAPALHCPGRSGAALHGTGFYANQVPQSRQPAPVPDIVERLRTVHVPALVIKGQCDYIDWRTAAEYVETIPGARLSYLRGAGHELKSDRPVAYQAAIEAFLDGRPVPDLLGSPTHAAPSDYQRPR